jgi:hypothetical protein
MLMRNKKVIASVLIAGAIWGFSEIFVGDLFYRFHIPMRAAFLTAAGMTILVVARLLYDRFGTSTGAAVLAGVIRCLVPKAYICHLVAIAVEGFVFDLTWTAIKAGEQRSVKKMWLASSLASYLGSFCFAVLSIYLFRFGKWVSGGFSGGAFWSIKTGSLASILLLGLVSVARLIAARIGLIAKQERVEDKAISHSDVK